jgi:hypothetical protein
MDKKEQLSNDFNRQIKLSLEENETIIWKGCPKPEFRITLLELGTYFDVATGATSILTILVFGMLFGVYKFYTAGNLVGIALTLIVGLSITLAPDLLKNKRKRNTKYAFSNRRVYFQLWRWGKTSFHSIELSDVAKITYQEYKDKSGVIHFLPKKPFDFYTYDFLTGGRRFYPSFEMVKDVIDLQNQLEQIRKENLIQTQ